MNLAVTQRREKLAELISELGEKCGGEIKEACDKWLEAKEDAKVSREAGEAIVKIVNNCKECGCDCDALCKEIASMEDLLTKKSIWIFGGDGWAYDIGYGGLDHVLASDEDVNVLRRLGPCSGHGRGCKYSGSGY